MSGFSNSNLSGTGIFLYFNQDNYTLSPSHQPIQTNLHRKLKYSLCLIISNETSLHLQQLKRATYNMLWFIERNPCFHIYRNVSDCYRWKHTRYSVYEVNVMLRERFGLGHRIRPHEWSQKPPAYQMTGNRDVKILSMSTERGDTISPSISPIQIQIWTWNIIILTESRNRWLHFCH